MEIISVNKITKSGVRVSEWGCKYHEPNFITRSTYFHVWEKTQFI